MCLVFVCVGKGGGGVVEGCEGVIACECMLLWCVCVYVSVHVYA